MMTTPEAVLHFRVPPLPLQARVARENVIAFASSHGIGRSQIAPLLAALGEALANAIEHAATSEPIDIEIRLATDRLVATIRDFGVGFDAGRIGSSDLPDGATERGRGLPIMRHSADIFKIESSPGEGTTVVVGVLLPAA